MIKSSNGIPKIVKGSKSGKSADRDAESEIAFTSIWPVSVIAEAARSSPRNIAPESPINIRAGWKLCGKKPIHIPITTAVIKEGAPARLNPFTTAKT